VNVTGVFSLLVNLNVACVGSGGVRWLWPPDDGAWLQQLVQGAIPHRRVRQQRDLATSADAPSISPFVVSFVGLGWG
jgi:hypothetical protein